MSKELIKELADIEYPNDKRMNDYIIKSTSDVIKTSQEFLVAFDKPNIKTRFCFGHGCNGQSTSEEVEIACSNAQYARTNEQYFLDENLEDINEKLNDFKKADKLYLVLRRNDKPLLRTVWTDEDVKKYKFRYANPNLDEVEATKEDVELIIKTLENEKAKFEKRLNTYLKKYGLSKIHSWTYLVD